MLSISDMPAMLACIIENWVGCHPEYVVPAKARGNCAFASDDLTLELADCGHEVDTIHYGVYLDDDDDDESPVSFYANDCEEMDLPPAEAMRYYRNARDCARAFEGHTVVRIDHGDDHWYVDPTARQMDPAAPYPLIWVVRGNP